MSVTDLTYKGASLEDVPAIFSMCKGLIDAYEDIQKIDYDKVISWVERKINANIQEYTCVMQENKKIGYFHLSCGAEEAELDDFYILPEYRGKGIGTQVLSYCIAKTQTPIFLYVFRGNTGAIKLYNRIGFRISDAVGATRLVMRREVDNY